MWCADGKLVVRCIFRPFFHGDSETHVVDLGMTITLPLGDHDCIQCGRCTAYGMMCQQMFGFVPYNILRYGLHALLLPAVEAPEFFGCRGTGRVPEFLLSIFAVVYKT